MSFLRTITCTTVALLFASLMQAQSNLQTLNLTFTTIDVPGAGLTVIAGMNSAGDMVGWYSQAYNTPSSGFLLSGGNFSFFDYPRGDSTLAFGINDSGLISGSAYIRNNTAAVSFLYNGTTFTTIRAPGDSATLARGINNAGIVVGGNGVSLSGTKGFALVGTKFKTVSPPGVYVYVFGDGINNLNQIVGSDDDGGFLYNKGKYQMVSVPGSSQTQPWGINDDRVIVGWYASSQCLPCGFALKNGKYVTINYPGAMATFPQGINSSGQIVGSYEDNSSIYHGFVTSPISAENIERSAGAN